MGRYNLSPQNVHKQVSQLLHAKRLPVPPPWYNTIGTTPPPQRLVRPPMQRPQLAGKKRASHLFKPVNLKYEEDALRWEYFNDHPWELARPRVMLENDGRDHEKWDWSLPLDFALRRPKSGSIDELGRREDQMWDLTNQVQASRPINGEAVVQRQKWLMANTSLTSPAAYDTARRELYRYRHSREVATRVAREEALAVGAFFGEGPLEIGMKLEDKQWEDWKVWAMKETAALKQMQSSGYTAGSEAAEPESLEEVEAQVEEVADSVPATKTGLTARGGAAVHA